MKLVYVICSSILIFFSDVKQCDSSPQNDDDQPAQEQYTVDLIQVAAEYKSPTFFGSKTDFKVVWYNDTTATISGRVEFMKPFTADIMASGTLFKFSGSNTWDPLLNISPTSVCEFMEKNKEELILFLGDVDIPMECPIQRGAYSATNGGPISRLVPSDLPQGKYFLNTTFTSGHERIFNHHLLFNLDPAVSDYED